MICHILCQWQKIGEFQESSSDQTGGLHVVLVRSLSDANISMVNNVRNISPNHNDIHLIGYCRRVFGNTLNPFWKECRKSSYVLCWQDRRIIDGTATSALADRIRNQLFLCLIGLPSIFSITINTSNYLVNEVQWDDLVIKISGPKWRFGQLLNLIFPFDAKFSVQNRL